jgi:hypothetical protein
VFHIGAGGADSGIDATAATSHRRRDGTHSRRDVEPAIQEHDAGSCVFRTGDDGRGWLALRTAMLGVDFDVHEPPELAEHLRSLAARLGRAVNR